MPFGVFSVMMHVSSQLISMLAGFAARGLLSPAHRCTASDSVELKRQHYLFRSCSVPTLYSNRFLAAFVVPVEEAVHKLPVETI